LSLLDDVLQRARTLSEFVSALLGGVDTKTLEMSEPAIASVRDRDPLRHVSLDTLICMQIGVCRHRSILFKYLCDHMHRFPAQWGLATDAPSSAAETKGVVRGAIPCQLVRGVQFAADGSGDAAGNHMWNVVRVGTESFVVDVMQRPGQLLPADSKEALAYRRVILAGAVNESQMQVLWLLLMTN
jgi:hypothetical protein